MIMHLTRHHPAIQTPLQSVLGNAALGCIACFLLVAIAARPLIERLQVDWAELIIFALGPILTALTILYACHARYELSGLKRLSCLFLASCVIFAAVVFVLFAAVCAACIFVGISRIGP